ncbi:MAG: YhdH/YhfP family quinone oxidoreductase [Gammaproteobacteria bacterium]|nr:YhdH/YhfP family quinone oxidoreductase [Gammaproteobacteria bacterium]
MNNQQFRALVVRKGDDGVSRKLEMRSVDDLPDHPVTVRVQYSALNFKDALSAEGHPGVTRNFPHTPGIDAAGVVESSSDPAFTEGQRVIVTSYDLGMNTPGGFGELIRVPGDWIVPLPAGLELRDAMIFGTAGLTAAMCLQRLESVGLTPQRGPVLVTGATGGVGSMAVAILARCGYRVAAVSGKAAAAGFLERLGASQVLGREAVTAEEKKPMRKSEWAGAVDTVGGPVLAGLLRSMDYQGAVACCGLVASPELHTTVYPFILRGVALLGVDSQDCPMQQRRDLWDRLAGPWRPSNLDAMARECDLEGLEEEIRTILKGGQTGRILVRVSAG